MNKSFLVASIVSLIMWGSCSFENNRPEFYQIVLVETSDVHGAIFNHDFINDRPSKGSLAQVYTYVKDLRKSNNVIFMDNGDILQGQPAVYYSNYENTLDTHICAKVMNYMQYDIATIGNHDIEAGHPVYDKLKNEFDFPLLAANAVNKRDGKPYFEPYKVIIKNGVKIAVLGLITPGIPNWLPEELWSGIEFLDMVETAQKWVSIIQEKENPDLLVGLFHSGYNYKYGNVDYDTYKNENASLIVAEKVPGFDIIFVGHDHETWNEKVKNINNKEVIVLGPASSAKQVATASIDFRKNANGRYDKKIIGKVVDISSYKPDSLFSIKFRKEFDEINIYVSRKVGEFSHSIDLHNALYGPSEFIDLIQEIQLDITHADISFTAPLSFNGVIEKGPVYVRDMFKLYRFENLLYTISLSGEEIDKYLEYSFGNWYNNMHSAKDHILRFNVDKSGTPIFSEKYKSFTLKHNFYNFDVASGIKYTVDISKEYGNMVNIIAMTSGKQYYADSLYTVAINSYRGNGGGGHLVNGVGIPKDELVKRRISSTDKDLRYYMMKWIEQKENINPVFRNEWKVIPEDWWRKAKEKDSKLLN